MRLGEQSFFFCSGVTPKVHSRMVAARAALSPCCCDIRPPSEQLDSFYSTHTYPKREPGFSGTLSQRGKYPPLHPPITLFLRLLCYAKSFSVVLPSLTSWYHDRGFVNSNTFTILPPRPVPQVPTHFMALTFTTEQSEELVSRLAPTNSRATSGSCSGLSFLFLAHQLK